MLLRTREANPIDINSCSMAIIPMSSLSKKSRWSIFSMVAVGVFLSTMDSSMINVALPSIMRSFNTSLPQTEWVVLIYLLTITVSLLFWGRMADRVGLSSVYLAGMLVFSVGSITCYLAPSLLQLIVFRLVQAIGAAMMMATGPAIIKKVFPVGQLGTALGLIGIATSIGLMMGPLISGILIHSYSWRAIFLVTVPLSLCMYVLGWMFLRTLVPARKSNSFKMSFDWLGMILWTGMIMTIVLFSTHRAGTSANILVSEGVIIIAFLALLIKTELRQEHPLFPLTLFCSLPYAIAMFCSALSFAVLFVVLILMPLYLDFVLGLSAKQIGFVMMAVPISVFIVSPLSGFLYDRIGARFLTTTGLTIAACGLLFLCFISAESSPVSVAWRLAVLGCGQALFLSPNSATVLENVKPGKTGISSGILATARNLGMLLGVSVAGLLFGTIFFKLSGGLDLKQYGPNQEHNFMLALKVTFSITAVFSLIGAILSSFRREKRSSQIQQDV